MKQHKNGLTFLYTLTGRREFVTTVTQALGTTIFLAAPVVSLAESFRSEKQTFTVGQIIDLFLAEVPGAPFEKTVDTLKSGNLNTQVTGVVTTMFATVAVIRKAIELGANFIIAHEPTFYNHLDDTSWLEKDDVYQYKANLLQKHNIAVWRNHDYIHTHQPDGVRAGLLTALGWQKYYNAAISNRLTIPAISLKSLITQAKEKLNIKTARFIGDLSQTCRRVLLMPGASGGRSHITELGKEKPDVIICGEAPEWETVEYIRDAQAKGDKLALVILGHAVSEEPGAEWLVAWLKPKLTGLKITHIPSGNPLSFI